jgi:hypothetical protein
MTLQPPVAHVQRSESEKASELAQQLLEYQQLRSRERLLRSRVDFMQKQAALQGPLRVDVDLALALETERGVLQGATEELRERLEALEQLETLPEEKRVDLAADQIEQLVGEIKARREQIRIYQDNVNFLEERRATLGAEGRLDWENELKLVQQDLATVRAELVALKITIEAKWGVDPDAFEGLMGMDAAALKAFATEAAQKAYVQRLERARQRIQSVADRHSEMVVEVLRELCAAAYPDFECIVPTKYSAFVERNMDWRRTLGEAVWNLTFRGTMGGVTIALPIGTEGEGSRFECEVSSPNDGRLLGSASAELSRGELARALRRLHTRPKAWWQFWRRDPDFPESWPV